MPIRLTQPVQGRNAEETVKNIISALRQQQLEIEHYLTHLDGSAITSVDYKPVVSGPATWEEAATNFNLRNDRNQTVPSNPVIADDGTAIDHIINTDGSATISLEWAFVGTGPGYDVDGFIIWVHSSTSATAYTFGTTPASETPFYTPADMRAFVLDSVSADKYYTFGVQAYRNVDQDVNSEGILKSSIVQPSEAGENPYRPSATVAYAGNIIDTLGNQIPVANLETVDGSQLKADGVRYDGQIINDSDVTAYFPFDDSLYDSKNIIPGTFARASVANLSNGVQVASGVARYDTARIVRGVLIEEGTTNLLTANQSSVETDTTGFTTNLGGAGTATMTRTTAKSWQGSASLKVDTSGSTINQGASVLTNGTAGTVYAGQMQVWVPVGVTVEVGLWDTVNSVNGGSFPLATIAGNNAWQRVTITCIMGASNTTGLQLYARNANATAITFYIDGLQIEQKPYPTSWILGGTTRAAETLTIPTAGVFQKDNWAVDLTYIPDNADITTYKVLWTCRIDGNNYYQLSIAITTGYPTMRVRSGGTYYDIILPTAIVAGTKYVFTVSGYGTTLLFCCNGVEIGSIPYVEPVGTLPSVMQMGTSSTGTTQCNGIIDELRFSKVARTLLEHQAYYNSNKGYTDIEPIIRAGLMVNGFMVTPEGGAKCYHSNGSFSQMSWEGFMNYDAGYGRKYFYYTEGGTGATVINGTEGTSNPLDVYINVPDKLKDKPWDQIGIAVSLVSANQDDQSYRVYGYYRGIELHYHKEINGGVKQIKVSGWQEWYDLPPDSSPNYIKYTGVQFNYMFWG
jgi:hypothetical protein